MNSIYKIYNILLRIKKRKYIAISKKFDDFSMIAEKTYVANLELANQFANISGAIVECGTWKGGMIAGIAYLLGQNREYVLFDSFEGLPEAKEIDGSKAKAWQTEKNEKDYYDNCKASEEEAKEAMRRAGINNPYINKGWFNETLPNIKFKAGIAILRMDADWYDSTMEILRNLFFQVNKGGVIIIDDYYYWEGCTKAVHDFLSTHKLSEKIRTHKSVCYIVKE